jgi:DNA repair protein RadA/Sms
MPKSRILYACQSCGARAAKWSGQCPECEAWNTLSEVTVGDAGARGRWTGVETPARVLDASKVGGGAESLAETGIAELDRVLGGGLAPGAVVLIGGDPGIGKSTLLLQLLARWREHGRGAPLYVTGEESPRQVVLRARRLGLALAGLRLLAETRVEQILALLAEEAPGVVVVDSIQTMYTEALQSAPGSVAQVRDSAAQLVRYAKTQGTPLLLVGHVTKEGALAGPRVLEHMVDTVLYFESDANSRYRVIRAVKNRFGAVNELGIFAMTGKGLREVSNPSATFLSRRPTPVPGSVVTVVREGTRPLLLEIQALLDDAQAPNPRRLTVGLDQNRLGMLLAVLHRHAGVPVQGQDVFVNVVGGVRIGETAADLPVLAAVFSSLKDRPIPQDTVLFGEIGLAGEIRPVPHGEERLQEAAKHGFARAIVPSGNRPRRRFEGLEVLAAERLSEALERL